jgi:hypothetical protein
VGTGLRKFDTDWITAAQRGLQVEQQVPVRVRYLAVDLDCGYRMDMLVVDALAAGGWKRVLRRE